MKFLSFKVLIACILLPPVLYILSVIFLEDYLTKRYDADVKNTYLSDITDILNGQTEIKASISNSIERYARENVFLKMGGELDITVTTKSGNIIYPWTYQNEQIGGLPADAIQLAQDNFKILNDGLDIHVAAKIKPFSFLAAFILLFYILFFLSGLYVYYRKSLTKARYEESKRQEKLTELFQLEKVRLIEIESLSNERESLLVDYSHLQTTLETEKIQAEKTEDEFYSEMEQLEQKLNENLSMQEEQQLEIDKLKEKIREFEKTKDAISRQKQKETDKLDKRFKALYKNIEITHRAIENLSDMTEEISLKAEEVIHQLNDDSSVVAVKRKVFTKKGNITAFEVVFAYSGRLYFRKTKENKVEILTIGTKNTQARDLAYIDNIQ